MPDEVKSKIEPEEPENDAKIKKGLPLKKYGIYGAVVIVMMAAAYFVTLKVVKPMFAGGSPAVEEKSDATTDSPEEKADDSHQASSKKESGGEANSGIFLIEDIIVNPAGTGGRRFLSTSIGFELSSEAASGLIEEREAIVRDALITILSSQSIPELSDFKQREKLRKLIKLRVEKLLQTEEIAAVYFTEFVLQ